MKIINVIETENDHIVYEIRIKNEEFIVYKEWLDDLGQVIKHSSINDSMLLDEIQNCIEEYWIKISGS